MEILIFYKTIALALAVLAAGIFVAFVIMGIRDIPKAKS